MKKIFLLLCLFLSVSLIAQQYKVLYNQSTEAYKAKDYPVFLKLTQSLDSIRPSRAAFIYNLACAYALNNKPDEAIETLKKVLLIDSGTKFEEDEDLASLRNIKGYQSLPELKAALHKTIAGSEKVVALSETDLHPEGLLYLEKTNTWLSSSIRKRKIVSFDIQSGQCTDWIKTPDMLSVFSLKADKKEQFLWASTAVMQEMEGFTAANQAKAEILKIDIAGKEIIQRFTVEGNHVFGDLIVAQNGTVYVSDSGLPVIYRIKDGLISEWLNLEKEAFNLQGITFNKDESKIYIADYLKGILMINTDKPAEREWLELPLSSTKKGIDGLVFYNQSLIAVHNGVSPIRVIQYFLDSKGRVINAAVIDNNRPEFHEPALAAIKKDALYFFCNAPWGAYDKEFNLDIEKTENPSVYRFLLNKK